MSKRTNTDPMGFVARRSPKTEPMLVAPPPPSPTPTGDLTATSEATTEESAGLSPAAPALSKAEIRSIFQDLSDGLGDPTARADAPESEVAQYAEPRPLRARNKTPALEPAILLRKSVVDEVLPLQTGARPKERRARVGTETVRAQRLVTRTRARIGVAVTVVALTLAAILVLQKREPEKVSDSKRTLAPNPSPPKGREEGGERGAVLSSTGGGGGSRARSFAGGTEETAGVDRERPREPRFYDASLTYSPPLSSTPTYSPRGSVQNADMACGIEQCESHHGT